MIEVAPGTVVVFSDLSCPWAHAAVHRFWEQRARLGIEGEVVLDHRSFPLERHNDRGTPKHILEAEIPVARGLAPEAGWQVWQGPVHEWASTLLLAMEAVQAAKQQSLEASEALDRALRRAFFGESRNIAMHNEIVAVAEATEGVDAGFVGASLEDGRCRKALFQDRVASGSGEVKGSPHFFLADGTNVHNPGVELHWEGEHGRGFPVIDADDPQAFERLLKAAVRDSAPHRKMRSRGGRVMDESVVREHAERHGRAVVSGELAAAGADLSEQVKPQASSVMKRLPARLSLAEVISVEPAVQGYAALIRYEGDGDAVVVRATWAEVGGRPLIVELEVE